MASEYHVVVEHCPETARTFMANGAEPALMMWCHQAAWLLGESRTIFVTGQSGTWRCVVKAKPVLELDVVEMDRVEDERGGT